MIGIFSRSEVSGKKLFFLRVLELPHIDWKLTAEVKNFYDVYQRYIQQIRVLIHRIPGDKCVIYFLIFFKSSLGQKIQSLSPLGIFCCSTLIYWSSHRQASFIQIFSIQSYS